MTRQNTNTFGQAMFATLSLLQKRQMVLLFCFCICHICSSSLPTPNPDQHPFYFTADENKQMTKPKYFFTFTKKKWWLRHPLFFVITIIMKRIIISFSFFATTFKKQKFKTILGYC
jgi:hypothetical protein